MTQDEESDPRNRLLNATPLKPQKKKERKLNITLIGDSEVTKIDSSSRPNAMKRPS